MTELNQRLIDLHKRAQTLHAEYYNALGDVRDEARKMKGAPVVDAVYVLKRSREIVDDTRKEINKCLDFIERIGCMIALQNEGHLEGDLAKGSGNVKQQPAIPNREDEPDKYFALMDALGIPRELSENRAIKPSFRGIGEFVEKLGAEGKPMPDGLQHARQVSSYTVHARLKPGIEL